MFSGEELKAKAPPVELCMIGEVIFFFKAINLGDVRQGRNLKRATKSTRGGKIVNVEKSGHLLETK